MNTTPVEILLVEDNPNDVELALHALRKHNLANHIYVVRDGEEALDFLFCRGVYQGRDHGLTPKVVLLDLKLPKVDGLEVLRQIVAGYKLGINSYIVKPVEFDQFTEAVRQIGCYWLLLNQPPML
jgi:two-component system response regulator